ncbi:T9SS type B sorting domain-containing protein [Flavobacterium croceum]|mgnify:CR=1 FL=1|uniref:T9SS type B sorting domain-containing protein n=1 Tax=Flavobacterium croceum TaxID=370975 RepID=UPI0024A97C6F|nr:T9SS type B sorting domain-containing protein [Flavobacterium croceum]
MNKIVIVLLLLFTSLSFAFNLNVTPTNETCSGNGSLSFAVSNTNPSGSLTYIIYKLPNTTTPISTQSTTTLSGLVAGDYKVVAQENVGSNVTTQEQTVTIQNQITPLSYTIQNLNQACSNLSSLIINVNSGTAATYAIINGPVLVAAQSSNTFNNLPTGTYTIKVTDVCGAALVQEFTTVSSPTGMSIGNPVVSNSIPNSCTNFNVTNTLSSSTGTMLGYPLTVTYVLHPPGGAPNITYTQTINTGGLTSVDVTQVFPEYLGQNYTYDISVQDSCSQTYASLFTVSHNLLVAHNPIDVICDDKYFTIVVRNFMPPYTINFTTYPAGFNPSSFTSPYPGPYSTETVIFGGENQPTPLGYYELTVTDACGRVSNYNFSLSQIPRTPSVFGVNDGCVLNTGSIYASVSNSEITSALFTQVPPAYTGALDVSNLITSSGALILHNLPLGTYTLQLTDSCNDILPPTTITIPAYVDVGLFSQERPGCSTNRSSVSVYSGNAKLTQLKIIQAPAAYSTSLPQDVSFNIVATTGKFYMNDLPPGQYTFEGTDACGFTNQITVTLTGYQITNPALSFIQNCGSFDINLDFQSNGTLNEVYWLQKLIDPATNTWGHPQTNQTYTTGTIPNAANGVLIANHTINYNYAYNGKFRIVRSFDSFYNGSQVNDNSVAQVTKSCFEILTPEFTYNLALQILEIRRMPCSALNGNKDVIISAIGTGPLKYYIIEKNGLPIFIDNGNSNVFEDLPVGVYKFVVEDVCGNSEPRVVDINQLTSIIVYTQPKNTLKCTNYIYGNETFNLTSYPQQIIGNQSLSNYNITFYTNAVDAQTATNAIPNLITYDPPTNPFTVYARIVNTILPTCYEITTFDLIVGLEPTLHILPEYKDCELSPITIDASMGNLPTTTYLWSDGSTNPTITITTPGVHNMSVQAFNDYGNEKKCINQKSFVVIISKLPEISNIETVDWTDSNNEISVYTTTNSSSYEYSIDGTHFQSSNTFTGLPAGEYMVYVKDSIGCGIDTQKVWLLDYYRFFTPNNDGKNDLWRIYFSENEPNFKLSIFDRYGKLIKRFVNGSDAWDGTYNGEMLFATDYWFVAERQDGRIHKGHFSLVR